MKGKIYNGIFVHLLISMLYFQFNSPIISQSRSLRFDHLSIKDGLPADDLKCVIQDHLGFIWVSSGSGLSRYDGYNFVNYFYNENDSNSAIRSNIVNIIEDSDGDIWAATNGGLSILIRAEDRFVSYAPDKNNPHSLSDNRIVRIFQDSQHNMWIGTRRGGLNFVNKEYLKNKSTGLQFEQIKLSKTVEGSEWVTDIIEDKDHNIWASTNNGLIKISKQIIELIQPIPSDKYNPQNHFRCIVEDTDNNFWIGTDVNGIAQFNSTANEFNYYPVVNRNNRGYSPNRIMSLLLYENSYLFAGPIDGSNTGILRFNKHTKHYESFNHNPFDPNSISFSNVYVRSMIEDNVGNIWITQNEGKLNIINKRKNVFKYYRKYSQKKNEIIFSRETRVLEGQDGRIWFTSENGLFQYFPTEDSFKKIVAINRTDECTLGNKCWIIEEDKHGNLWTGGHNVKLRKYNPFTKEITCLDEKIKLSNADVHSILSDKNGNMWFGTWKGGVDMLNTKTNEIKNYKFRTKNIEHFVEDMILEMSEDSSNSLWIAPNIDLLYKLDKSTGKVKRIVIPKETGFNCDLFTDSKNRLWAGMKTGGIYLFNTQNDNYQIINTNHGLPSMDFVTGFSEDQNGNIFFCNGSYLVKANENTEIEGFYDIASDDEALYQTYYIKKTNEVYVVSDKGFYRFFPDNLKPNLIPPKMALTDFKFIDKSLKVDKNSPLKAHINIAKQIILEYWQNNMTIQYSGLHYVNPRENKYKYILLNYDKNWIDAGRKREAIYTNLEHGEYTFKVLGSNSDGLWATEPAVLSIIIYPPWWKTNLAYAIYILIIITFVTSIWRILQIRLKLKHQVEIEHIHAEKYHEINKIKARFFANISHEFRTPLTLILGPVERIISKNKNNEIKYELNIIQKSAKRLNNLINQLLDLAKVEAKELNLKASKDNFIHHLKGILFSYKSLAEKNKIELKFVSQLDSILIYFDKEMIDKIFNNLLSNAFKYTNEGGAITIGVSQIRTSELQSDKYESVEVSITDTGIGIPPEKLDKIFDRFYQVDESNLEEKKGTGIGLSIAKEMVEMHHGTITVESELGRGTTFKLLLPIGKKHLKASEIVEEPLETDSEVNQVIDEVILFNERVNEKSAYQYQIAENSKPIVLVVEDNSDVREYVISYLNNDYRILEASDGVEGWNMCLKYIPDIIISDVMMPNVDGFQLCMNIKTDERTCHIPVILLTAKASEEDKIEGLVYGADAYLLKPFEVKELLVRIKALVEQREKIRKHFLSNESFGFYDKNISQLDTEFLEKTVKIIETHIGDPEFDNIKLANELAVSRAQLYRKLNSLTGESPNKLILRIRLDRAAKLIRQNFGNISEVALEVGFNNPSYFSRCFNNKFGKRPSDY